MRRAFTLVELLVTMAIVALLVGISLGALRMAANTSREKNTLSAIRKLDAAVQGRMEEYRTRRLRIDVQAVAVSRGWISAGQQPTYLQSARIRLDGMRELQRLELPHRYEDVTADLSAWPNCQLVPLQVLTNAPSLSASWLRRINDNTNAQGPAAPSLLYQSAECLYLIAHSMQDEFGEPVSISTRHVGDADLDGMLEYQDGWGNPISFLRWAPGYVSDHQPAISQGADGAWGVAGTDDDGNGTTDDALEAGAPGSDDETILANPGPPAPIGRDAENNHDPFDPLKTDMPTAAPRGWRTVPLIYSAGEDGAQDIWSVSDLLTEPPISWIDPYYQKAGDPLPGEAFDTDGEGFGDLDNITNQDGTEAR